MADKPTRLEELEAAHKKCVTAYAILGEAFDPVNDPDRKVVQVPVISLLIVANAGCPDMPGDLQGYIVGAVARSLRLGLNRCPVDLEALDVMNKIASNAVYTDHYLQKSFTRALVKLEKIVHMYGHSKEMKDS